MDLSYVLPLRSGAVRHDLGAYLIELCRHVDDVVVVDGSPPEVFARHATAWDGLVRHVPVDEELVTPMGKVGGVLTGLRLARHDKAVIADDDVRWEPDELRRLAAALEVADVVRPQNWFDPLPWHARWDTGRILLNRAFGGDWPGTLGLRRRALLAGGGYAGDVMFENLELVRTVRANGGRELVARDLLVRRLPPTTRQFLGQRVRQAYDELARPAKLAMFCAIIPALLVPRRRVPVGLVALAAIVATAEAGRRRGGGGAVFPASAALWAPCWVAERAVTSWLALASRVVYGGVRYRGAVLTRAATPSCE